MVQKSKQYISINKKAQFYSCFCQLCYPPFTAWVITLKNFLWLLPLVLYGNIRKNIYYTCIYILMSLSSLKKRKNCVYTSCLFSFDNISWGLSIKYSVTFLFLFHSCIIFHCVNELYSF